MLYAIIAVLVIIADQWVKFWVEGRIPLQSAGEKFISGIISLVNVHNDGAAFGFLSGGGARIYFIILTGVFTVAVILALATKFVSNPMGRWSLVMMTAGGLSNCIDRVMKGYVQDMFKLDFINFPVFNVADIFITVFCLLFVVSIIFGKRDSGYDDEFEEVDDEEEDRPRREKKEKKEKVPKEKPVRNTRKARKAKYEDEYEQYKASRAARQPAQSQAQSPVQPQAPVQAPAQVQQRPVQASASRDPFAEWERANARAGNPPREPAAPVRQSQPVQSAPQRPAPAQQRSQAPAPAAPKKDEMDFDLDDILAEFK